MNDEMQPYPLCNRAEPELRQKIGQLFESLPGLTEATFTIGGRRYRARLSMPWVTMDVKAARGWQPWTEYPTAEFYRRRAMGPNWQEQVARERGES